MDYEEFIELYPDLGWEDYCDKYFYLMIND